MEQKIRLIPEVLFLDGATTMALHEHLMLRRQPALVLSHFVPATVTFGKNVHVASLPEACKNSSLPAVRRMTGGEILYHAESDITYAFTSVPEDSELNISKAALSVMRNLMDGLECLGIKTYSRRGTSIFAKVGNVYKKIAGSAPCQEVGRPFLVHGSIFYDVPDFELLSKVYCYSPEQLRQGITWIKEHRNISLGQAYESIRIGFINGRKYEARSLSDEEIADIKRLAEKYAGRLHYQGTGCERPGKACAMEFGTHMELKDVAPKYIKPDRIIE
ncbi:MAG: hypothetical protein QW165_01860 [Candidatus Woesearchaeota archaeon]